MNYDSAISDNVNLSRVLDELVMDGTDFQTIVQFLKTHERDIPDIYKHSAFVYDLYDIAAHPGRLDVFLIRHVEDLPNSAPRFYAASSIAEHCMSTGTHDEITALLKEEFRSNKFLYMEMDRRKRARVLKEDELAFGSLGLVEYLNSMTDGRDFSLFISNSYFAMAAFQAATFMRLNPDVQFVMIRELANELNSLQSWKIRESGGEYAAIMMTLLKQLVVLGHVDMFNWVVNVIGRTSALYTTTYRFLDNVPPSLVEKMLRPVDGDITFEEVVFEMNLVETQFDSTDLFLFIYLDKGNLFKGMKENKELLEFFNLTFDWNTLEWERR